MINRIKEVIDNEYNKERNYEEIINKTSKKREFKARFVLVPASILVIALISVSLLLTKTSKDNNNVIISKKDNNDYIYINEEDIQNTTSAQLDVDARAIQVNDMYERWPFLSNIEVPEDMELKEAFLVFVRDGGDDYTKERQTQIVYEGTKERDSYIEVAFTKEDEVLRCLYYFTNTQVKSRIGNTELQIVKIGNTSYYTKFRYNDLTFEIEGRNVTGVEFIKLLKSIIV